MFYSHLKSYLFVFIGFLLLTSCIPDDLNQTDINQINESNESEVRNCNYGDFHNFALMEFYLEFDASLTPISSGEAINILDSFYYSLTENYTCIDAHALPDSIVMNEIFWVNNMLYNHDIQNYINQANESLDFLIQSNFLTSFEGEVIKTILNAPLSHNSIQQAKYALNNNPDSLSYNGSISHMIVSVAQNSFMFWESYSGDVITTFANDSTIITSGITPVHIDIGGVIVGTALGVSYNLDSENIVSRALATGIMTGVVASSGVIGRVGRWVSTWFV